MQSTPTQPGYAHGHTSCGAAGTRLGDQDPARDNRPSTVRVTLSTTRSSPVASTRAQSAVDAVKTVPPPGLVNSPSVAAALPNPHPLGRVSPTARIVKSFGVPSAPVGVTARPASRSARSNSAPSHSYPTT